MDCSFDQFLLFCLHPVILGGNIWCVFFVVKVDYETFAVEEVSVDRQDEDEEEDNGEGDKYDSRFGAT